MDWPNSGEGVNMGGGVYVNAPVRLNNLIIMENIAPLFILRIIVVKLD